MIQKTREEIVTFGEGDALVGIATDVPPEISRKPIAIIIANAGILHRVGPCRSSVVLAREVANRGYLALRFDYSGLGDSGFSTPGVTEELSNCAEISAAFDEIERRYGINRFVVHGLCSGARDAFNVALVDKRVVGISQIDGYAYRTLRFHIKKLTPKIFNLGAWMRLLQRNTVGVFAAKDNSTIEGDMTTRQWPEYPPRKKIAAGYQKLVDRRVKILSVFTGGWLEEYNYGNQFYDMYREVRFNDQLSLHLMPHANHIMSGPGHFDQFVDQFHAFCSGL